MGKMLTTYPAETLEVADFRGIARPAGEARRRCRLPTSGDCARSGGV